MAKVQVMYDLRPGFETIPRAITLMLNESAAGRADRRGDDHDSYQNLCTTAWEEKLTQLKVMTNGT